MLPRGHLHMCLYSPPLAAQSDTRSTSLQIWRKGLDTVLKPIRSLGHAFDIGSLLAC